MDRICLCKDGGIYLFIYYLFIYLLFISFYFGGMTKPLSFLPFCRINLWNGTLFDGPMRTHIRLAISPRKSQLLSIVIQVTVFFWSTLLAQSSPWVAHGKTSELRRRSNLQEQLRHPLYILWSKCDSVSSGCISMRSIHSLLIFFKHMPPFGNLEAIRWYVFQTKIIIRLTNMELILSCRDGIW